MKAKKIIYFFIVTIIVLTITLTACEKKNTNNSSKNEDLFGKITVWSEGDNLSSLKISGENFKKLYPKVQIAYVNVDKDNLYTKIISGFASNSGLPDVFSVKDESIPMFVNKFPDGFLDISSTVNSIKSKFIDSKMLQCSVDGKFFAVPWDVNPTGVFYRKDIFKKANVFPEDIKTWEDYINVGKTIALSTAGGTKMLPIDEKNQDMLFREMLNQLKTGYFDKDGKIILDSKNSIKAMEIINKLNLNGLIYKVDGVASLNVAIKNGLIATLPYGSSLARQLIENDPEQAGKWGVIKLPVFEEGGNNAASVDSSSIMITKASKNTKVALKFAEFAATDSPSLMAGFNQYGILPSYTSFYDTEDFDKGISFFENQKIWLLFSGIAKDSVSVNYTKKFAETKSEIIKAQTDILNKHSIVQTTMDALQTKLNNDVTK